ncbi:MAG: hypothetical protein HPY76_00735 [Anaerolineae bacterium]|nr:hypothetical protein [Anaerolineae bacterium]
MSTKLLNKLALPVACALVLMSVACNLVAPTPTMAPSITPAGLATATVEAPTIIPATATMEATIAPEPLVGVLQVAFTLDGNVHYWAGSSAPRQLTATGEASRVWISPDGTNALFTTSPDESFETLNMVRTNGSQPARNIASVVELPGMGSEGIDAARVLEGVWSPDSQSFIFTTSSGAEGWSFSSGNLYMLNISSGEVLPLLIDQAVEMFALSPDGRKIAIGTPRSVFIYFIEDGEQHPLYDFEARVTYSEAPFVPQPFWSPESVYIYFALAPQDFLQDPATEFFRISIDGSYGDVLATAETGAPLVTSTAFAPVGYLVAYTRQVDGGTQQEVHVLGLTDNINVIYNTADIHEFQWCPNSGRLTYRDGNKGYTLINYDGSLTRLPDTNMTQMRWVDNDRYLYVSAADAGPQLILASPQGTGVPVAPAGSPDSVIVYDFTFGK